jgi:hypothetical protein
MTHSSFNDRGFTINLFAILVRKLGGKVTITQADLDDIAYCRLFEEGFEASNVLIEFRVQERTKQ